MLGFIVTLIIVGLLAGAVARLLVPGRQPMSIVMTIVLGIVGSFVGGFLGYLLFHKDAQDGFLQPAGIIGSIIGAIIVLLIWSRVGGRRHVTPRLPDRTSERGSASTSSPSRPPVGSPGRGRPDRLRYAEGPGRGSRPDPGPGRVQAGSTARSRCRAPASPYGYSETCGALT